MRISSNTESSVCVCTVFNCILCFFFETGLFELSSACDVRPRFRDAFRLRFRSFRSCHCVGNATTSEIFFAELRCLDPSRIVSSKMLTRRDKSRATFLVLFFDPFGRPRCRFVTPCMGSVADIGMHRALDAFVCTFASSAKQRHKPTD